MIDNQTNTDYSKLIKNYEIPLGGVWSLVRIQSPRLVKMKELSGWLSSFLFYVCHIYDTIYNIYNE